jgi:hypothetical protein
VFQFINLYGPDFVEQAVDKLDPLNPGHQVVTLKTRNDRKET